MGIDDNERSREMALFRYSAISQALHLEEDTALKQTLMDLAERFWTMPDGSVRKFAWGTLEDWYYAYRSGGLEALETSLRKDKGQFRHLPEQVSEAVDGILRKHPKVRVTTVFRLLVEQGMSDGETPSLSTVYRYIRKKRPSLPAEEPKDRRAFEAPYSGSLTQVDLMYGPHLQCLGKDGKYRNAQTYLIALIDDHSRLLCHGQFYFEQNLLAYLDCLKQAILKRGIPERIYCDNGQIFISSQIKRIAAKMGCAIVRAPVRDGAAKGKIERFFLKTRQNFLDACKATELPKSLDELNQRFSKWCESYNMEEHSAIETTPLKRWMASSYKLKLLSPLKADEIFLFEDTRKVKNDGTFQLLGRFFETHSALAGKKVEIIYDPFFPEKVSVKYDRQDFGMAHILDRTFNASLSRRKPNEEGIFT